MVADAFYLPERPGVFAATAATAGPWDAGSQHGGPPCALLARAMQEHEPVAGQRLARVTVDFLRPVPVAPLTVRTRTVRPGRRITLIEAVALAGDQEVLHARGWRVGGPELTGPVPDLPPGPAAPPVPADPVPPIPAPVPAQPWPGVYLDGYLTAMQWRFVTGAFTEPGPAQAWLRPSVPLVAGEVTSPMCLAMLVADSGSGISSALDPRDWLFINVDLTVALHRPPRGDWLLLDSTTTAGAAGSGIASSRLRDPDGDCGQAVQTLLIAPR